MVKPEDISPPYPRAERRITIHDRVWYLPVRADVSTFRFPGWYSPELFRTEQEIHIEFCSGNGSWIAEKARLHPELNWLAVEKRFDRARKIWSKIQNNRLPNLVVAFAEAMHLSTSFIPPSSVSTVYVNFPDPWPKNRHAKHRIISTSFFIEVARILRDGGGLIFVTDDEPYSELFIQLSQEQNVLHQEIPPPSFVPPPRDYGTSFFDSLFTSQGKTIRFHSMKKNCPTV